MKSRRMVVTLELDTNLSIVDLRDKDVWRVAIDNEIDESLGTTSKVIQVQANVIKVPATAKKSKR